MKSENISPNPIALIPLGVFLLSYLAVSLAAGDFYKMPITVAFVIASVVAVSLSKGKTLHQRIEVFCKGAADSNIMLMVLIFILAGAFAHTAKAMGAVDATVNLTLSVLPGNVLAAGIFLAACVISISVGTSVGTIVALTPVAAGLSAQTGLSPALMSAVVVSGAMFGDNLSFISDTTIVATRTQGCKLTDKFKTNFHIVLPFAILTTILYIFVGSEAKMSFVIGYRIAGRHYGRKCDAGTIGRNRVVRYNWADDGRFRRMGLDNLYGCRDQQYGRTDYRKLISRWYVGNDPL